MDFPSRIVLIGIDEGDRLPGSQMNLAAVNGQCERRGDECRKEMVGAVAGRSVGMAIEALLSREHSIDRLHQVFFAAASQLHESNAGRGMGKRKVDESVAFALYELLNIGGQIDDGAAMPRLDFQDVRFHVAESKLPNMDYVRLGGTGLRVSPLCLGCMMFGTWGNPDHEESVKIIHRAIDAGINFLDTANVYSGGESEEIVGKALKGKRDDVVLATKCHFPVGVGPNDRGNTRAHIMRAIEDSLRRLDTDYIDLYQIHRPDPKTDIAETLGALTDLVRQGKVRYLGSSTFPGSDIVEAQWVAERRNLERFVCEQPPYSILVRDIENEMLPLARKFRMGVIVWSPLAGGWLSGKYRKGQDIPQTGRAARIPERFDQRKPENQAKYEVVEKLTPLADKEGITLPQLGIAWTLEHPSVTASIIGPRTMEQLEGLLGSAEIRLSAETLDAIDEIVPAGSTVNQADLGYDPIWLRPWERRRTDAR